MRRSPGPAARIVTREVAGVAIKTLDPPVPFAYAVDRPAAASSSATRQPPWSATWPRALDPQAGSRFRRLKATAFADAHSWFCLDLAAVQATVENAPMLT